MNDRNDNFQDKLLKKDMSDEKNDDEDIVKVLWSTNELQEKRKFWKYEKIVLLRKNNYCFIKIRNQWEMFRWGEILLTKKTVAKYIASEVERLN